MKRVSRSVSFPLEALEPSNVLAWASQFGHVVWLDSNHNRKSEKEPYADKDALLAVGAHQKIILNGKGSFDALSKTLKNTKDYFFGYLAYDLKNDKEALQSNNPDSLGFDDLFFFRPEKVFIWKDGILQQHYLEGFSVDFDVDLESIKTARITGPEHEPIVLENRISKQAYLDKVKRIKAHIRRGDIYEVNFCQEFYAENSRIDPVATYQNLNEISRAPFASFLKYENKYLICSSPERFVKKMGNKVISQPIKGTSRRLRDTTADRLSAFQLANDPKERAENIMIVDLVRNDLSRSALKGSVKVEELCKVYTFHQVHQMISTVVSEVRPEQDPVALISELFPMGSMTGAPKISAMQIIEEEEESRRGLYSGAVGYFSPEGDFDLNVVIRSILYNASKDYISFSVGSAITDGSVAEKEYEECLLKAEALLKTLT